ncbi:hypothetical protein [Gillisia limnaea]|uniref:Lipoprotein n=1 Tax=Gillisia limnaea (strain DSM 15749 / LMG 21470 / R-8282) TaxID=865937 RepID=H2BX99_GILLR|nr:hypothetical protein [Gillisia limnaea]EHQ03089.1 hypothetical protein Gilli_2463 [Gillisia limnaea DSM 15749]
MKKLIIAGFAIATLGLTSCSEDDDIPTEQLATCTDGIQNGNETGIDCGGACAPCEGTGVEVPQDEDLSGLLTEDFTLTNDIIWEINGKFVVGNGATLTIEPGTIIKGMEGTGSLASALIVARGGRIMAEGTAEAPIVFTSINDNIAVGEKQGSNLDENDRGLWGGVIVLGNAPSSFEGDSEESQIEGIPADDDFGRYGGSDPDDNSGVLRYISIRHGGALIGAGNEINGLTLGGVGAGTVIDHIEVVGNVDDGVEWFGGTVNSSNLVVFAGGDDGLDIDQAYSGTITNALVIQGAESDHALEIDGPEGTLSGAFIIQDLTIIGDANSPSGEIADFRDGVMGAINNVYVTGFNDVQDVEIDDAGSAANYTNGTLSFSAWEIVLPEGVSSVADIFNDTTNSTTLKADSANFATSVEAGSQTVGADLSVFGWTYASFRSAF